MSLKQLDPPGTMADPFEGNTWQGWFQKVQQWAKTVVDTVNGISTQVTTFKYLGSFTVANLPASATEPSFAYATNGRKVGEGVGAGTGVPVYFSAAQWRVYSTDAQVLS